jgi:twinkle protein
MEAEKHMSYQLDVNDIFGFASSQCAETHQKGDELVFKYCPYCNGGDGRDRDTFAINLKKGVYNCKRASCGKQGHFVELCRDFDYPLEIDTPTVYKELAQPKGPAVMRESSLNYLEGRGIHRAVAERYDVTARKDKPNILCFPFYDENGKMVTIKYRNMMYKKGRDKSKEWFEKDTMPILFGMKQCVDFTTLVITEGQIDSLSVAEAGIKNAVSVPNGCSSFTWLTPCAEWVNRFEEVIVFGDWEHGKMTLLDTLKDRLDCRIKAVRRQDYLGEKDANDILVKYGPQAIVKAINNAEEPKISNVKDLSMVKPVDINKLERVKTGIWDIDRDTGGLVMGEVIVLSGERGQGKSTFLSQIICNVLNQKDPEGHPYSAFVYSGELTDQFFKRWMDFQLAGPDNITEMVNEYGEKEYTITMDTVEKISQWYRGRMYIYDNAAIPEGDDDMTDVLLRTVEQVIRQYGIRVIAIDNLMTALESIVNQNDLYLGQSQFVGKLKKIAMKYNVCIIVVAHPRKSPYPSKSKRDLDNDDVSGSADVTNKADVVLTCSRDRDTDGINYIQILKNRLLGRHRIGKNSIKIVYSPKSRRMDMSPKHENFKYGWETIKDYTLVNMKEEDLPF